MENKISYNDILRDTVNHLVGDLNDRVEKDLATVSSIDERILDLITERNYILYGLNCKTLAANVATTCLGFSPLRIWNEYKKFGFNSNIVKQAIKNLRILIFDDNQKKFQAFFCTQIDHNEYGYGSDIIDFIFEDETNSFKISFNIKRYEDEFLYNHKVLNGYIYFTTLVGKDYYTITRTFDINKLRKSIEKWIDNGFKAESFKYEHGTLLEKAAEIIKDFQSMSVRDVFLADEHFSERVISKEEGSKEEVV